MSPATGSLNEAWPHTHTHTHLQQFHILCSLPPLVAAASLHVPVCARAALHPHSVCERGV